MNKFYFALFACVALSFGSCSSTNYTHEAEDDVYFSSQTEESIEVFAPSQSENDTYDNGAVRNYPNSYPGTRTGRSGRTTRTNDPTYCPPSNPRQSRTPRTSTPSRTSQPSSTPAPSRESRPSRGGRPM